ncbi:dUTP diphosphatase [Candidatus Woesearchaeota archaeon CG10_big_fil_rev_8_21_14_0_10_44_13]|nr:MAG: dUTP diphosphatase [Candidatus Woesearchaeota archaeon CG10_big_fil_rev_8_21_14_0_10_44_13]
MKLKVKKLQEDAILPQHAKKGDAAIDLSSCEELVLKAGEKRLVRTGISLAIPEGFAGFVWDRSGLAANHSVHSIAGVVDSGYRGEVKVVLINLSKEDFRIEKGMRIAQMAIQPVSSVDVEEVRELDNDTERGKGGFGSTGR